MKQHKTKKRSCAAAYPEETRPFLGELVPLWVAHLWDNIPTVREDSALALARAVAAYGPGSDVEQAALAALRCVFVCLFDEF
jgi:hypothetical protein